VNKDLCNFQVKEEQKKTLNYPTRIFVPVEYDGKMYEYDFILKIDSYDFGKTNVSAQMP
jgi:hypothetical protein